MTDEQQLRELLAKAAELPDTVEPPVRHLLRHGHRRRKLRTGLRAVTVGVFAVVAVAAPQLIRNVGTGKPVSPGPATDLTKFRWSLLPASPLRLRQPAIFTLAGREVLEIGGHVHGTPSNDGAAFDLATKRWHVIAPVPADVSVASPATVWTGRQLFVADARCQSAGSAASACVPHAGLYTPQTNRWYSTPLPKPMDRLASMTAAWNGRVVILTGVTSGKSRLEVAIYDPERNRWQMITPHLPPRHTPEYATAVSAPNGVVLWTLWDHTRPLKDGFSISSGVSVFALRPDGSWRDVTDGWPQHESITTPTFTAAGILIPPSQIWCGAFCSPPGELFPGRIVDPVTLRTTAAIPLSPLDDLEGPYIWTGEAIIELSQRNETGQQIRLDETVEYDQAIGRWRQLPAPPGRPFPAAAPVWTGTELLLLTSSGHLLAFRR